MVDKYITGFRDKISAGKLCITHLLFAMKTTRLTREQERETAFPYTLTADTGNKHASCPLALSTVYKSQEQQPVASLLTLSTDTIRPKTPQPPTSRCNLSPKSDSYPPSSLVLRLSSTIRNDRNGMHQHRFIVFAVKSP